MGERLLRERAGAILMFLMLAVLLPAQASASVTVTDDSGRSLTLPHTPRKIISLAPGATEMLFAAGAGASVIATVEFAEEPPEARRIPRIGDANSIDIERVVALRPDVIVVWEGGNNLGQVAQLERLGLPLYRHRVERLDDLATSLRRLGALAGTAPVAESAAQRVESRIRELARTYSGGPELTVLLEVWNRPIYTVGGSHIMTDALRLCGARNVFGDLKQKGPAVDPESVIARDPQVIVAVAPPGVAREWLDEWRRYPSLRAVRRDALVAYEDSRLSRLGPSILDGTAVLCEAIARTRR